MTNFRETPDARASAQKNVNPRKQPVAEEPLRFGIDVDGTISQAPHHFKDLIDALLEHGSRVYIITGRAEDMRQKTEELLDCLSIRYSELVMRPIDWPGTVTEFKVRMVREKKVHLMIDDDARNCWAIEQKTQALAAHMLPIPEMPEARAAKTILRKRAK